jgi:hypothetical protein
MLSSSELLSPSLASLRSSYCISILQSLIRTYQFNLSAFRIVEPLRGSIFRILHLPRVSPGATDIKPLRGFKKFLN